MSEQRLNKAAQIIKQLQERVAVLERQIPMRKIKYYKREPPKEVADEIPEDVQIEFNRIKKLHENDGKRSNSGATWLTPRKF